MLAWLKELNVARGIPNKKNKVGFHKGGGLHSFEVYHCNTR
jgi:hypothetical protein